MLKKIAKLMKKICMAFLILYGFNLIVSGVNIYVPMNTITTGVVTVLGIPGLLSLVAMFFIIK